MHSLVLIDRPEDRGVYRRVPVRIMGAKHDPPEPYLVPVQMEQLMIRHEEMTKTMHPVERVELFHLLFEGIHPFIDGNGRTGRLLLNFELNSAGFPPINVKFTDRKKYYDCFSSYYETGSHEKMALLVWSSS
ncbi:MAG: Fic family protein [Bacillota bacterium]